MIIFCEYLILFNDIYCSKNKCLKDAAKIFKKINKKMFDRKYYM